MSISNDLGEDFAEKFSSLLNASKNSSEFNEEDEHRVVRCGKQLDEKNEISFLVIKNINEQVAYTCPFCKEKLKIQYANFSDNEYLEWGCNKCDKKFLLQLDFTPNIKMFIEK